MSTHDIFFNSLFFFFFNDTATTEIYTLSLHDALPILTGCRLRWGRGVIPRRFQQVARSEEHTSELQSHSHLVCRLLLAKKKRMYASLEGYVGTGRGGAGALVFTAV